jgi:alanyl aminopeptidase
MPADDWTQLRRRGLSELSDAGKLAVADSLYAELDRGAIEVSQLLPWFRPFAASPIRQLAVGPMGPLRFMMVEAASDETRPKIGAYGERLYRNRYRQLGWRAREGDSSDTKLLREALVRWMVMDVRNPNARARASKLGRIYAGYGVEPDEKAVDPQLADLVLAAAVQEGDERFFDHLLAQLEASTDATKRSRILVSLGHAETEPLSRRALDLALDPRLRLSESAAILGVQLRSPRTRERGWAWLKENFDAFVARAGSAQAGDAPWYAASLCSREDADDVQAFFRDRAAELAGGPRNLSGAVEAIRLCAAKAEALRPAVAEAFR